MKDERLAATTVNHSRPGVDSFPDDWKAARLSEVANVIDSLHRTPSFTDSGYSMVRVSDIKSGDLELSGTLKVSEAIFDEFTKNYRPKKGDIVLSRVGSYGVSSFVKTDEPFCMGQNTVVIDSYIPSRFLYYSLNSSDIGRQIEDRSFGTGYKSLSLNAIKNLWIPLPPLPEQEAIAEALADVDALLAALDKLIAKKRAIKQAAMQQLLTGKTRLPGFTGNASTYKQTEIGTFPVDWLITSLGDVTAKFVNGGTPSTRNESYWTGNIPWITGADILRFYPEIHSSPANHTNVERANCCAL